MPKRRIGHNRWADGPHKLPNKGNGRFNTADSDVVERAFGITADVRRRKGWSERQLTLHGKDEHSQADFDKAKALAVEILVRNQASFAPRAKGSAPQPPAAGSKHPAKH